MTEAEWLDSDDLPALWEVARARLSHRQLRLFGVAYCGFLRKTPHWQDVVVFEPWAELAADGKMTLDEAHAAVQSEQDQDHFFRGLLADDPASRRGPSVTGILALSLGTPDAYQKAQQILRCIAGNPFRPTVLDSVWRTANVIALAQTIYDDRAFDRLPILADALEDAGCTDRAILDHCRQPGEHTRGCWVVDLVLGKE